MMRKNIKEGMAWLLISGLVTTSSGGVALANDRMIIQKNSLILSKEETVNHTVLFLSADMVQKDGTILVEKGKWEKENGKIRFYRRILRGRC